MAAVDYIAPRDLHWDREAFSFVLEHLRSMREGSYPAPPAGSSSGDIRSGKNERAPFEMACQVAAEADARLMACGRDGALLELYLAYGVEDTGLLAKASGVREEKVQSILQAVLSYCASGECRRYASCERCRLRENCKRSQKGKREPVSYKDWREHRKGSSYA